MWSLFFKGRKNKRKSPKAHREGSKTEEEVVSDSQDSPRTPRKNYLFDEIWDILPKTGYTYARSGSHSPRFFGVEVVMPNMSRYRIRDPRTYRSGSYVNDEVDGEYDEMDYSDYETEEGMETVIQDGMELRSGKNLYTLEEHFLEQEALRNSSSTNIVTDMNYSAKTRSEKKTRKSQQNLRQLSLSERKRYSTSNVESYSGSNSMADYSGVRGRRNLENSYSGNYDNTSNSSYSQSSQSLRAQKSNMGNKSRSEIEENNSSVRRKGRYSVKTVTTVTEEYADYQDKYQNNGVVEKGSIEPSEKQSSSSVSEDSSRLSSSEGTGRQTRSSRYIKNMYGLDEDEFSEDESRGSYLSRGSYGENGHLDDSPSTITTIVTTVTETITKVTHAVVSPVWNTVGRPVVTYVAVPTWSYVVRPAVSTFTSIITSVLLLTWSVLTYPVTSLTSTTSTHTKRGGVKEKDRSVVSAVWSVLTWPLTYITSITSTRTSRQRVSEKEGFIARAAGSVVSAARSVVRAAEPVFRAALFVLFWPLITMIEKTVYAWEAFLDWYWDNNVGGVFEKVGSVVREAWSVVETSIRRLVIIDMWLFRRRRGRGCCLCLPLLLLLPLLLALYAGREMIDTSAITSGVGSGLSSGMSAGYHGISSGVSAGYQGVSSGLSAGILGIGSGISSGLLGIGSGLSAGYQGVKSSMSGVFSRDSSPPPVMFTDNKEYASQLNDIRSMIVQYQESNKDQLTAADVEAIVYKILNKQTDTIKADLEGTLHKDKDTQVQWKADQDVRLGEMKSRHDELLVVIQDLESTLANQRVAMATQGEELKADSSLYLANLEDKLAVIQGELRDLEKEHAALLLRVNACCQNETYYAGAIKDNVNTILAQMMAGHMSGNPSQDAFTDWLHSNYVSRDTLDARLKELANDLTTNVMAMIQDLQQKQQAQAKAIQASSTSTKEDYQINAAMYGVGEQQVREMIEAALFIYSADKTGIPDFALESAGGTVVSTRCSETYDRKTALIKVFGLPLWYVSNSPRTVLQPEVYPGQCWAFKGPTGYIVIQTSAIITPTGFTLEHIPKSLAPSGEIDSAPKDFTVFGLIDEYDDKGSWFGNFTYNDDGNPIQYFPVSELKGERTVFNLFELRILNNYGNAQYTCLYRFRIHGKPYRS